jgi:nucleotide-binding universal stress UspA family protein
MRVLIAVDDTDNAGLVMESVSPWLRQAAGEAAVLTVLDSSGIHATDEDRSTDIITPQGTVGGSALGIRDTLPRVVEDRSQAIARVEAEIRDRLSELAARHLAGVPYEIVVASAAHAADGIIDAAWEWGADIIVLGTHARTGLQRVLLGSVAEAVVRHSPISVLLIREGIRERKADDAVAR